MFSNFVYTNISPSVVASRSAGRSVRLFVFQSPSSVTDLNIVDVKRRIFIKLGIDVMP